MSKLNKIWYPNIIQAVWLLVLFFILNVIVIGLFDVFGNLFGYAKAEEHPAIYAATGLLATFIIILRSLKKIKLSFKDVFSFAPVNPNLFIPIIFIVIGSGIILSEIDNLSRLIFPSFPTLEQPIIDLLEGKGSLLWSILVAVIIGPVTEELLFRGLILRGFLQIYSRQKAIIVSAVLFGIIHLSPGALFGAIVFGIILAWWYTETGSLVPCIFGHALNNAVPIVLIHVFNLQISGLTDFSSSQVHFQPIWLDISGVILMGAGLWLFIKKIRTTRNEALPCME